MPEFRCGFVALVGRPNVGKSTLLNTLVGERIAAVSPKAQTTRRRFRGIRTDDDSQLIFVDTPGMHRAPEGKRLNEFLVAEALDSLRDVDAVVYIVDGSRPFKAGEAAETDERFLIESLKKSLALEPKPLFVLLNKQDLWSKGGARFSAQDEFAKALADLPVKEMFPVAAKSGAGLDAFLASLKAVIPVGPAHYPAEELTDQSLRTVVGELIQEKLFYLLGDELPYSCAVEIEQFLEPGEGRRCPEIHAAIHVEKESQKPMVIGKGGSKIKEIGQTARESIERLVGGKVVLKLFVKVTAKWSKNAEQLKQLGYVLPENN
ncbi:MAG TPA: GTPase Era [Bdellovibrionota bacterium]|jgi:GTP-binding protein Era